MATSIFKAPTRPMPRLSAASMTSTLQSLDHALPDGVQPYAAGRGIRRDVSQISGHDYPVADGFSELVRIEDGLCALITSVRTVRDVAYRYPGENWLKLELWLSGKTSVLFPKFGQIDFEDRWCFVHIHQEGIDKGEWLDRDESDVMVTLYCRPQYLARCLGDDLERLPDAVRQFALQSPATPYFEVLPVTAQMARAAQDMVESPFAGALRILHVEARAKELFAHIVGGLMKGERCDNGGQRKFRTAELRRLGLVRDHIHANLGAPLRIEQLCSLAAMNQQKLQQGFQQLFGMPIYEYFQERRLEWARKLLESHNQTVTQVALTVGYEYANNFSTAFRRRYGMAPKAYQKKY